MDGDPLQTQRDVGSAVVSLTDSPETALEIAGTIHPFGLARGAHTETCRWLDRALDNSPSAPTLERIGALYRLGVVGRAAGRPVGGDRPSGRGTDARRADD